MFLEIILTGLVVYCIHAYFTKNFNYFKCQGISGPKPVPIFGNYFGVWKQQYHRQFVENQSKYGKIYGTFDGRKPNLVVADPEMLRGILVKNFDCFTNRPEIMFNNRYLSMAVGGLRDQEWKNVRGTMSVAFTSGKLKKLFSQMEECALGMVKHLDSLLSKTSTVEINAKEITTGYALDVISSCGLGMKIPSIRDPNDPFVKKGMRIMQGENGSPFANFFFVLVSLYPKLAKLIPASAFAELDFFIDVSKKIIEGKKSRGALEEHVDILELLLQSSKQESSPFQNEDMIFAQVLVLLLAGLETAATSIASTIHCLAMNQGIQQRLRDHVRNASKTHGGINYDCLQNLPYLDQCIFEALRLYPTNAKTERLCGKTVSINNIKIEKGTAVTIPLYAIHHDPETYPKPQIYDPERFSPEEKAKRDSMLHSPFGHGPRSCLGQRLAMEELRLGLAHLVTNFKFDISPKTQDPIEFMDGVFILTTLVAKGVWVTVQKC